MSNATPTTNNAEYIDNIKIYISEKKKWQRGVPGILGPASPMFYEKFVGDRGEWIRKTKRRIDGGNLNEEEGRVAAQKSSADAAFRSGRFQDAADFYTRATEIWGHPHNAVCYSNLAAAFLKLERWSDAEVAGQKALREHLSMHGFYYGIFHVKAFHRLGLANTGLGRYEVAETYFRKALRITPNNALVSSDMEVARKSLEAVGEDPLVRAAKFDLTEQEVECIMKAGANPWDEDVQDLLERGGLRPDTLKPQYTESSHRREDVPVDRLSDPKILVGCSYCHCHPTTIPLGNCPGCSMAAMCSERCSVLYWPTHESTCMNNRQAKFGLSRTSPENLVNYQRAYRFTVNNRSALNELMQLAMFPTREEDLADKTVFEQLTVVVDLVYDTNLLRPTQVVSLHKMEVAELERTYSSMKNVGKQLKEMSVQARQRGYFGEAMVIVLVKSDEWECTQLQFFTLPKNVLDKALPYPAKGWQERWMIDVNKVERDRM